MVYGHQICKNIIDFKFFYFFEIPKRLPLCVHPGESKNALRVVGGAWGPELRTSVSRVILTRSSCKGLEIRKMAFFHVFSSKNDFSTVCKYEKHCMFPVISVFCHN